LNELVFTNFAQLQRNRSIALRAFSGFFGLVFVTVRHEHLYSPKWLQKYEKNTKKIQTIEQYKQHTN